MAVAAVCNKLICLVKSLCEALCSVHSQNGRKLFVSEFLADVNAFNLTDENFASLGNLDACKLGNLSGGLTYNLCVQ